MKKLNLIAILLLLVGCSQSSNNLKHYHRLDTQYQAAENSHKQAGLLWIQKPAAYSILGGRPMVATLDDGSLVQASQNLWLETPKILLQAELYNWAKANWQQSTIEKPANSEYFTLKSQIVAFEKRQQTARIAIEFTLLKPNREVLMQQTLAAEQQLGDNNFSAFAYAMGKALQDILQQLQP